jgi:transcriptional regulator with XRE-family HTH domain
VGAGGGVITMPTPGGDDFGRAVRRLRRARCVTIEALAHEADMHPTYLSGIERGVRNPTWVKICALADALGVPVVVLVRNAEVEAQLAARVRQAREKLGLVA